MIRKINKYSLQNMTDFGKSILLSTEGKSSLEESHAEPVKFKVEPAQTYSRTLSELCQFIT
jgi:hypothetical protein